MQIPRYFDNNNGISSARSSIFQLKVLGLMFHNDKTDQKDKKEIDLGFLIGF